MKPSVAGAAAAAIAATAVAQTIDFSSEAVGSIPAGWVCGVTGRGSPKWAVSADAEGNVLLQSGSGTFPWCVRSGTVVTDGSVETTFKPISGPVAPGVWHKLRVDFAGTRITVSLDGKRYIEVDDAHIAGAGLSRRKTWRRASVGRCRASADAGRPGRRAHASPAAA